MRFAYGAFVALLLATGFPGEGHAAGCKPAGNSPAGHPTGFPTAGCKPADHSPGSRPTSLPASGCEPADPALAGHYYLHGVMEVGSELLLRPDGSFEYMLAYGALDELASGCWTRNAATVTLHVQKFENSMEDPMKFRRLDLTVTPDASLTRSFDPEHVGAYARE